MDEDAGGEVRVGRVKGQPLEDDHEDQVTKQTQHEEQLWDQYQEYTAQLVEMSGARERKREGGEKDG